MNAAELRSQAEQAEGSASGVHLHAGVVVIQPQANRWRHCEREPQAEEGLGGGFADASGRRVGVVEAGTHAGESCARGSGPRRRELPSVTGCDAEAVDFESAAERGAKRSRIATLEAAGVEVGRS